jgi:hypothetical protein
MLLWLGAIAVVVGLILLIVSIQKVFSCIKAVGISMIVAGIPYFAFLTLTNVIKLPDVIMQSQNIISNALNTIMTMFLVVLILGIILAIIGVVGRHYYNEDGPKKRKK